MGGYWDKLLYRYFGVERSNVSSNDSTLSGWRRSLMQLDCDADIAFFGDTITIGGNWQEWFPEKKVINLGVPGMELLHKFHYFPQDYIINSLTPGSFERNFMLCISVTCLVRRPFLITR